MTDTSKLTPEYRAELQRLCDEATAEPWDSGARWVSSAGVPLAEVRPLSGKGEANAHLIAAARAALPLLLARVTELEELPVICDAYPDCDCDNACAPAPDLAGRR